MRTAVNVIAGVHQRSVGNMSVYNQFLQDKKNALKTKIEEETGIRWDEADATGNNGTSTTGDTACNSSQILAKIYQNHIFTKT